MRFSYPAHSLPLLTVIYTSVMIAAHPHPAASDSHTIAAARRLLEACRSQFAAAGHEAQAIYRRAALAETLGEDLLARRDFDTALETNHHSGKTGLGAHPSAAQLFGSTGKNSECVLSPEVTVGPYWVKDELVRSNIADNEPGVPLYVEFQFIDYKTCKPVPNAYIDIWHANATGVYSGVIGHNNGNEDDHENLKRTYGRGVQKTDSSGVASFSTIFPGHYLDRATHIHLIATLNAGEPSGSPPHSPKGGHIAHIGQAFFDTSLIEAIEALEPYSTNTQPETKNEDDRFMRKATEGKGVDPFMQWVWLGKKPADGVLAWSVVGIDMEAQHDADAEWTGIFGAPVSLETRAK